MILVENSLNIKQSHDAHLHLKKYCVQKQMILMVMMVLILSGLYSGTLLFDNNYLIR